jgi:hypothetical protein
MVATANFARIAFLPAKISANHIHGTPTAADASPGTRVDCLAVPEASARFNGGRQKIAPVLASPSVRADWRSDSTRALTDGFLSARQDAAALILIGVAYAVNEARLRDLR